MLHVRDILIRPEASPSELARPAPRLQKTTTIPEAVSTLQDAHAHVGIVTDAARGHRMVSLNDLLGESLDVRALVTRAVADILDTERSAGARAPPGPSLSLSAPSANRRSLPRPLLTNQRLQVIRK